MEKNNNSLSTEGFNPLKTQIIIGLGSSIGDKKAILDGACNQMRKLGENFRVSSYIESEPLGGVATNTFLNAVCSFETMLTPEKLLDSLQIIENRFGRTRTIRWEDRTLDLDILYYGNEEIQTPRLTIPHPEIKNRDFVLGPLSELFPIDHPLTPSFLRRGNKKNIGVFIGRMQPIHIGHQKVIQTLLNENETGMVIFGSSGICDTNNIFSDSERELFLQSIFGEEIERKNLLYGFLEDYESDKAWVQQVFQRLKTLCGPTEKLNKITFYGGDLQNDYAIQAIQKYKKSSNIENIAFKEIDRKKIEISSTQIRSALKKNNTKILENYLDKNIFRDIKGYMK